MNRTTTLNKIKELKRCDLLVIGGGATGCGIALDAAARGLSVVLAEKNDFAEGTSSRSSKLVHGGVRYLEMAVKQFDRQQYQLVKEGLEERYYFLRNAPHLSHRLPVISPLYSLWDLPQLLIGLKLYDRISGKQSLGPSTYETSIQTLKEFPLLNSRGLIGGIRYYDGQFNDCRMTVSLALSAKQEGALVSNHLEVVDLLKNDNHIEGAVLEDRLTREHFKIKAQAIVNATGPFCDQLRRMDDPDVDSLLTVSSGVHIVLDQSYPPPKAGLLITETEDKRVLFILPWQGRCLVGTTDQVAGVNEHPKVTKEEIDYLLRHLEKVLDPPPTEANITASWSGLRPLVKNAQAKRSSRILRDFVIEESESGLFTITGGKWTSYRRMAEKLVEYLVKEKKFTSRECRTRNLPVYGGKNWEPEDWRKLVEEFGFSELTARYLHSHYGTFATEVAQIAEGGFSSQLCSEMPCIEAEVIYACRCEMAERVIDLLARRLPLALLDTQMAMKVAPRVLELMKTEKRWDMDRAQEERILLEKRLSLAI